MTRTSKLFLAFFFLLVFESGIFGQVQITLPQLEGFEGQEEYTSLSVSDLSGYNVLSIQFNLYYDKNVVSIEETELGNLPGLSNGFFINVADTASGLIKFAWAGTSPLSGQGNLISFKIKFKSAGRTILNFNNGNGVSTLIFNDDSVQYAVNGGLIKVKGVSIKIDDVVADNSSSNELIIPVNVTDFDNIGAVSLKINFDPSVIFYSRAENINPSINLNVTEQNGVVTIGWFDITGSSPVTLGDSKFLDLVFNYNTGSCSLQFIRTQCEVSDSKGQLLNVKYYDGFVQQIVSGVDNENVVVENFSLEQNFPNPFNAQTKIKYSVPDDGYVVLKLFNSIGEMLFNLNLDVVGKGMHEFTVDCSDYSSGIYFILLQYKDVAGNTGSLTATRKLILLR